MSTELAELPRRWRGLRRWAPALAVCLAATLRPSPARAEEPPLVLLELERCDELDEGEVRRITAAELGARAANIGGDNVTQVTVTCQGSRVTIRVVDPLSRKSVARSFDIALSDPRARSRLVAIAATELVLASWTELESNPTPHVEPAGSAPSPAAKQAAREIAKEKLEHYEPKPRTWYDLDRPRERMLRIVALASGRAFFTHSGTLHGGGLRIGEEPFKWFSWAADVLLERGTLHGPDVDYEVTTSTASGALLGYVRSGVFTARLGAGLRAGLAASTPLGGNFSGTSSLAPWGWPLGTTSFSLRGGSVVFDLSGEAGYVVLPVRGGGTTMDGGWFSVQFGIGFVLPTGGKPGAPGEGEEE